MVGNTNHSGLLTDGPTFFMCSFVRSLITLSDAFDHEAAAAGANRRAQLIRLLPQV